MLAWLKGAKTMPARMEKKIYQQNWRQRHQWLKKKTNYSVFIYSEAAPDAKYAIYKHTRKFRVLQYLSYNLMTY